MSAPSAAIRLGLIGAPNSGKTTLFNALTGLRAKVANYPGVTVERREARVNFGERAAVVIDLPGTYSLEPLSPDEAVVLRVLDGEIAAAPDALVAVADACSLERSLPFVGQVLLRGRPTCLVLTMMDELTARGGTLDLPRLERALGIPVLGVVGHRGRGLDALVRLLGRPRSGAGPCCRRRAIRSSARAGPTRSSRASPGRVPASTRRPRPSTASCCTRSRDRCCSSR
jgi:ferrous iron transport protein B